MADPPGRLRRRCGALLAVAALVAPTWLPPGQAAAQNPGCAALSARQQAAQLVMSGVPGTEVGPAAQRLVAEDAGSVLLLGRNVVSADQLRGFLGGLRAAAPARLLVAVDEEGGRVSRLGQAGITTRLPSARDLAGAHTPAQVRDLAARLGAELAAVGIDWNLAPVLDVTGAPDGTVIGDRSFSAVPEEAAAYGAAFADGLAAAGVLTAGKHFPGHGRTSVDSHVTLPVVDTPVAELVASDLLPYRRALPALAAVMTAHVHFTAIDADLPASLSPAAVRLLRDEVGFEGLVMTDALEMGAITQTWAIPDAAEAAVAAGADLVLVADPWWQTGAVTDRIAAAVEAGSIPRARLQEAARRVLRLKGYGAPEATCLLGLPPAGEAPAVVGDDGIVYAVRDGVRHRVPDPETLRVSGLAGVVARYDQSEVDGLPRGEDLTTARRFQAVEVAGARSDPVAVGIALSRDRFADGSVDRVVVARADDYADVLAGAPLAGTTAPLLLLPRDGPAATAVVAEVQRVLVDDGTLFVLGGQAALPDRALGPLADDDRLWRVAGVDRYDTALRVAQEVARRAHGSRRLQGTVLLARGDDWVDAVAAGPLAAARGWPLLLTTREALPAAVAAAVDDTAEVVVVGGTGAISDDVIAELPAPRRLGGTTRIETAVTVARDGWGRDRGQAGDAFLFAAADGGWQLPLVAAGRAAAADAPLLWSQAVLPDAVVAYLEALGYSPGATATVLLAGLGVPTGLHDVSVDAD